MPVTFSLSYVHRNSYVKASFTFLALLRVFFASGLVQLQFLTHELLAIELQCLLHVLLRCEVHIAKFPVDVGDETIRLF